DLLSDVGWIVAKLLEKVRRLRYQSAAELRADLKRIKRDSESTGVRAMALPERPKSRWRSTTLIAGASCALLVVLLALAPRTWRERLSNLFAPPRIHSVAVLPFVNV